MEFDFLDRCALITILRLCKIGHCVALYMLNLSNRDLVMFENSFLLPANILDGFYVQICESIYAISVIKFLEYGQMFL